MSRWQPNARERLQGAALTLYAERGFDETTVADIAERAGLTERTFFRHFADKREVLFDGSAELQEQMVAALAGAPPGTPALDAVGLALAASADALEQRQAYAGQRQQVITATPVLQERELIKLASLAAALAAALRERGVPEPSASLVAEAGIGVFKVAFEQWLAHGAGPDLAATMAASLDALRAVTAPQ